MPAGPSGSWCPAARRTRVACTRSPVKRSLLIVSSYFHPYVSGMTEYARLLAADLAPDWRVVVLTARHDPALPGQQLLGRVRIVRSAIWFKMHKGYISGAFVADFIRQARAADVVNLHLPMLEAGLLAWLVPRDKLVVTYHCNPQAVGGGLDRLAIAGVRLSANAALARARHIVVTTRDYARAVLPGFARHDGKIVEAFAPLKALPAAVTSGLSWLKARGSPRIGFLGRFVREKGIDVLLAAMPRVLAEYPDAELLLAGRTEVAGGSQLPAYQEALASLGRHVRIVGNLEEGALRAFYSSLDLFVLPSINAYEAFGMVQLEAMSCGTRVVATDLPGVRQCVLRTQNGTIVPPRDAQALAAAICAELARAPGRTQVIAALERGFPPRTFYDVYRRVFGDAAARGRQP